MEEFWLVLAVHSKLQAQPSSAKVSHFQPNKPGTLRPPIFTQKLFSDTLVHFGSNGWNGCMAEIQPFSAKFSPKFSHFGWKWLKMAAVLGKWLNLAEYGWIFGCLKGGRVWLQMVQLVAEGSKKSANTNQKNSHSQLHPFLAWWLYLSRG